MLCRFCFSHRNFGCFDLVCLIVPSTFVILPIGITVICNIICLWMGNLYAATPGQNPGVARIYIYMTLYSIAYPTTIFSMSTFLVKDDKHALIVTRNEKRANRLFCLTPLTCSLWTKFIWQVAGTVWQWDMSDHCPAYLHCVLSFSWTRFAKPLVFPTHLFCQTARFSNSPFLGCPKPSSCTPLLKILGPPWGFWTDWSSQEYPDLMPCYLVMPLMIDGKKQEIEGSSSWFFGASSTVKEEMSLWSPRVFWRIRVKKHQKRIWYVSWTFYE